MKRGSVQFSRRTREFAKLLFSSAGKTSNHGIGLFPFFEFHFYVFYYIIIILYRIVSNRLNAAAAADLIVTSVKFILLSSV